jgi:hypothetical protein
LLNKVAAHEERQRHSKPLTRGEARSAFAMTELDQVEGIHADHGGRQLLAQRLAEGRRRVEATTSTPSRQAELRAASQAPTPAESRRGPRR